MKPPIGFVISIFLLLLVTTFSTQAQNRTDCQKVNLTVDITEAKDGKGGSIKVSAKDSTEPFRLHLLGKGNGRGATDDQINVTSGMIENIKPGKYELVIHYDDATYCTETRKVTVN